MQTPYPPIAMLANEVHVSRFLSLFVNPFARGLAGLSAKSLGEQRTPKGYRFNP
jgi:hypothetical protein